MPKNQPLIIPYGDPLLLLIISIPFMNTKSALHFWGALQSQKKRAFTLPKDIGRVNAPYPLIEHLLLLPIVSMESDKCQNRCCPACCDPEPHANW